MSDKITEVRRLLDEIEAELGDEDEQVFLHNFNALEVPAIVADIIRGLQPLLNPYEAAVYWHMFGRSVLKHGQQHCRVSTRGLMSGVVLSASGKSTDISIQSVRSALKGLEEKGAIRKAGEPSREGTPYTVLLPDEIPECRSRLKAAESTGETKPVDEKRDIDYYNVPANRLKVFERDDFHCHYCEKQLTRFTTTLDHIQPVSKGGDNSLENLVTACLHCNSERGNRPVSDFIAQKSKPSASDV